ncbi:MAG: hypothetical protein JWR21_4325 [Herminiimonas sp.]|nr:hypothetical protein [Herminiimonas sp.]MDB5855391.1 hypothetical protein [Herminiimonas sp.]
MRPTNNSWLLLVASLPTSGATARMRLWRAIKSLGCAALRDGAYILPASDEHAVSLAELCAQTNEGGGQAWVVDVLPRSREDNAAFTALFDRSVEYNDLIQAVNVARKALASQSPLDAARTRKRFLKELEAIQRVDFFPSDAGVAALSALADFEEAANTILSPGEPLKQTGAIHRLQAVDYQGRTWATRRRLWVDRVASAWLIRRFIDTDAKFLWLDSPAHCPPDALGFDFDNASFTHVGDKVTFEVLLASFGLEEQAGMARMAALVHALDAGGEANTDAAGFEAILSGARFRLRDDDELLKEMGAVLDSLLSHYSKGGNAT